MLNLPAKTDNRLYDCFFYHNSDVHIGIKIKAVRRAKKLSQKELGKQAGVSQATISDLERGKLTTPRGLNLLALAAALDFKPEWFSPNPIHRISEDDVQSQAELWTIWKVMAAEDRVAWLKHGRLLIRQARAPQSPKPTEAQAAPEPIQDIFSVPVHISKPQIPGRIAQAKKSQRKA